MTLFAIRNKRTKKLITGTDYRYNPPHQRTNPFLPPLLFTEATLYREVRHRMISSRYYEVVTINIEPISAVPLTDDNMQRIEDRFSAWLNSPD